ncbi:hypothetical protein [Luteibacter sp.]|uniref:hypothetical protein n=1 Tax=Luteibacter sp. TaxID=1886636 RepID=UPI003F7FB5B5
MGNEIVAARSSQILRPIQGNVVPLGSHAADDRSNAQKVMDSALALLRMELERADAPAMRRADPDLVDRLFGIYGLLHMADAAHNRQQG